jgi:chorismate dehydratase
MPARPKREFPRAAPASGTLFRSWMAMASRDQRSTGLLDWELIPAPKPRVSVVSYLNTAPLVWGMLHGEERGLFDLERAIPSECADRLADGRADIGIVPSVELNRQKLDIIPGCGIACRAEVRSILLISKLPFPEIRTLAADSSSRTSVALTRIVLARKFAVEPSVSSQPPHLGSMLENSDAALIIGDAALVLNPVELPFHVLDLGLEWTQMTGLPMVFAVWAARAGFPKQDPAPFAASLQFGMQHIGDIVREEHPKLGISESLARDYLTRNIIFHLGEREYAGLATFLQYASELRNPMETSKVTA